MNAVETKTPVKLDLPIININRTVGTILSNEISNGMVMRACLLNHPCEVHRFRRSEFWSIPRHGVTLELEGDANDYVGKGLSGGRIIVYPSPAASFPAEDISSLGTFVCMVRQAEKSISEVARPERFAVRNSGCSAVIEGVGDHGCEYMTGGRVVILGGNRKEFCSGYERWRCLCHDGHRHLGFNAISGQSS